MLMMMCCWNGKQPVYRTSYQHKSLWVVLVSISILWGGGRGYGGQNALASAPVPGAFATASGAANGSLDFCFTAKINSFKNKKTMCRLSASACVGAGLFCIVCLWDKTYLKKLAIHVLLL